jgi:hypothetical protein
MLVVYTKKGVVVNVACIQFVCIKNLFDFEIINKQKKKPHRRLHMFRRIELRNHSIVIITLHSRTKLVFLNEETKNIFKKIEEKKCVHIHTQK